MDSTDSPNTAAAPQPSTTATTPTVPTAATNTPPNASTASLAQSVDGAGSGDERSPRPQIITNQTVDGEVFYSRIFGIVATALLGAALYQIIAPFLGPMVWAMFIAFLLHPLHTRFIRKWQGRENLSAALLTTVAFLVIAGPLTAMSAAFVSQAGDLVHWAQTTMADQSQQHFRKFTDWPVVGPVLDWAQDTFGLRSVQIQTWIADLAKQLPKVLAGLGGQLFLGALNTVFAFVVMLFMLFFFLRDGARLVATLRDLVPMNSLRRDELAAHVAGVTRAVVFGTGVTALVQGMLVGLAFLITGLSSPLVFAVLAALLALLPVGGTALVWIPAVFILGGQQRYGMAAVMLVFGVLSSSIDNILRPLLISGRADVGTLTVFVGVLGGTSAFGPIGLFLGPVVLALIIALVQFARDVRRPNA